jgi:hypothetical protein
MPCTIFTLCTVFSRSAGMAGMMLMVALFDGALLIRQQLNHSRPRSPQANNSNRDFAVRRWISRRGGSALVFDAADAQHVPVIAGTAIVLFALSCEPNARNKNATVILFPIHRMDGHGEGRAGRNAYCTASVSNHCSRRPADPIGCAMD